MAKPRLLAFDGNYVIMRSWNAFGDLSAPDGRPSGALYGYIASYRRFLEKYRPKYYIPLFDHGRSSYRTSIDASYKCNRDPKPPELLEQMRACREFVELLGGKPYEEPNVEADDLAAKVAKDCRSDYSVLLLSADHDWQQLVGDGVTFLRPRGHGDGEDVIDYGKAYERLGWPPDRWAEMAAIMGDPGDDVAGISGYGPKRALKTLIEHGDLWSAVREDPKLEPHASRILMNYDLTRLTGEVPSADVPVEQNRVKRLDGSRRNAALREFLESWGMTSFVEDMEDGNLI